MTHIASITFRKYFYITIHIIQILVSYNYFHVDIGHLEHFYVHTSSYNYINLQTNIYKGQSIVVSRGTGYSTIGSGNFLTDTPLYNKRHAKKVHPNPPFNPPIKWKFVWTLWTALFYAVLNHKFHAKIVGLTLNFNLFNAQHMYTCDFCRKKMFIFIGAFHWYGFGMVPGLNLCIWRRIFD